VAYYYYCPWARPAIHVLVGFDATIKRVLSQGKSIAIKCKRIDKGVIATCEMIGNVHRLHQATKVTEWYRHATSSRQQATIDVRLQELLRLLQLR